jgi:GTPase SAR1 family protein
MKEEVFISYAWIKATTGAKTHDSIVSDIEKALKKDFNVAIDKKHIKYKDNIKEFEERLGKGDKIVLVISDNFLKSKHCMYEVLKIQEKGNIYNRIFPIVLSDANIYDSHSAADYIKHWENEAEKLNKKLKSLKTQANTTAIRTDLDNFTKFRAMFDDFRGLLSNMNTLSPETHKGKNFKDLLTALKGNKPKQNNKLEKEFENEISRTRKLFERAIEIVGNETKGESKNAEDILEKIKHSYQQCKNKTFQIAVMAMVKSGKSTFLNALLGDEFLPMSNVPETSVPVKIIHSENGKAVLLNGASKVEGATKIKKHIEEINKEKRDKGFKYEVEFHLHAPFKILEEKQMTDIKFEILDTPGFGEALTEITVGKSIDESNTELIDKISAIIYLLDYTKLKTKDEDEVLNKLVEMRSDILDKGSDILDKIQDRIFFVINKIDEEDRNSLPPEKAIEYVYKLVKTKVPKVPRQHFFTVSANQALLSRLIIADKATNEAKQDFGKIAFGFSASKKDNAAYKESAIEILDSSRISDVESNIINYIFENRSRIFIDGLKERLKQLLKEFKNIYVTTAKGALSKTITEIEDLELKIEAAKKKQENIQEEAEKFETEIRTWIENEFKGFEKTTIDHIDSAFNFEKAEEKKFLLGSIIPKWVRKIQNYLRNAEIQSSHSTGEEIKRLIEALNKLISMELFISFSEFKKQLEQKVISKQSSLFDKLKLTINSLAREFEATLKKALQINLEIVELRLDGINPDKALSDANSFLEKFIKQNYRLENVQKESVVYNHGSWCERGRYETRVTIEPEWVAVNNINKNGLEIHWKKEIEVMNTNAKTLTNHLIESSIKSQIKNARNSFNTYVDDYMKIIQEQKRKLTSSSKEEIEIRMLTLAKLNDDVTSIIDELK